MKIELQSPYKGLYKSGYLLTNKEPRNLVLLVDYNNIKTSTSYARYLMSCKLNRFLLDNEHVDHIDNNKLNDIIENLQILSPLENTRKSCTGISFRDFICPICGRYFKLEKQQSHKINPTCSRKCGGIKSHITKNKK